MTLVLGPSVLLSLAALAVSPSRMPVTSDSQSGKPNDAVVRRCTELDSARRGTPSPHPDGSGPRTSGPRSLVPPARHWPVIHRSRPERCGQLAALFLRPVELLKRLSGSPVISRTSAVCWHCLRCRPASSVHQDASWPLTNLPFCGKVVPHWNRPADLNCGSTVRLYEAGRDLPRSSTLHTPTLSRRAAAREQRAPSRSAHARSGHLRSARDPRPVCLVLPLDS